MRNYDYKEQIQRRKELQKMDFISGVQAGRLIRHFLNTFEPDITVNRFRKRCKELQKDLREDVPHKVLYSSRGTRYYWLQENVLSFLRNRINVKSSENDINKTPRIRGVLLFLYFFRPNGRPIPGWRQSLQYVYIRFPSGPWR